MEDLKVYPFALLQNGVSDIQTFLGNLNTSLEEVSTKFNGVIRSGQWDSDGAQAFNAAQTAWSSAATEMAATLLSVKQKLNEAALGMQTTDNGVAGLF